MVCFLVALGCLAGPEVQAAKKGAPAPPSLTGKVGSVDLAAGTVTVEPARGEPETLVVDGTTLISAASGKSMALKDLRPGTPVRVNTITLAGKLKAVSIRVESASAAKAPAAPATKKKKKKKD